MIKMFAGLYAFQDKFVPVRRNPTLGRYSISDEIWQQTPIGKRFCICLKEPKNSVIILDPFFAKSGNRHLQISGDRKLLV